MNRRWFLAGIAASAAWAQKPKQKGAEVQVLEAAARTEEQLLVDGRVRNTGDRPIQGLMIFYEVLDSDQKVLTRQKGPIDEETLQPGDEASFSAQMQKHARAVYVRFEFQDSSERDVRSPKAGPFPIEQ